MPNPFNIYYLLNTSKAMFILFTFSHIILLGSMVSYLDIHEGFRLGFMHDSYQFHIDTQYCPGKHQHLAE